MRRKLRPWRPVMLKLLWLIPLAVWGFCWPRILEGRSAWVETNYAGRIYPTIRNAASVLTSLVPISVAELVLYALVLFACWEVLAGLIRWAAHRTTLPKYLSSLLSLALLAAVLLNLFFVTWGFNYFREPLAKRMGLTVKARSVEELSALVERLSGEASALRETLPEDENGVFRLSNGVQPMLDAMLEAYEALSARLPVFGGRVTRAKRVLWSEGLSYLGIAGIFVGFTGEPNVNVHQPDLLLPQGAAHETAHQLGIASENEAEFAGYLACQASDDPCVRYSGLMLALLHCGNALAKADPGRYYTLAAAYGPGLTADFVDYNAYWDRYEGELSESADRVNDAYLKFNAQQSGVKSYGESVDLLLAYYEQTNN